MQCDRIAAGGVRKPGGRERFHDRHRLPGQLQFPQTIRDIERALPGHRLSHGRAGDATDTRPAPGKTGDEFANNCRCIDAVQFNTGGIYDHE